MGAHIHRSAIALLLLVIVAGCAPRLAGSDHLLLVGSPFGVSAVQPDTGSVAFAAPRAVLAPDRSHLFNVQAHGSTTRVAALDAATGQERSSQEAAGSFTLGALSATGRFVALVDGEPQGYSAHPPGRERTAVLIVDTTGATSPRRIELAGNIEPEAFSTDERSLFVIDYLPPLAPDRYRVRRIDLDTGSIAPVRTRSKLLVEEEMRGHSRQQVRSPDGRLLYTLYLKEDEHVHARDLVAAGGSGRPSGARAFVHVLHLEEQWAFCLDLPHPFGQGPARAHALAVSPDGGSLYVVDWSSGSVAVASSPTFQLRQRVKGFMDESGGHPAVARTGRGVLYVAGGDRLLALHGSTLSVVGSHRLGGPVSALELSPDGSRLYAGLPREVAVIDPRTWRQVQSLSIEAVDWLARVEVTPRGGKLLSLAFNLGGWGSGVYAFLTAMS